MGPAYALRVGPAYALISTRIFGAPIGDVGWADGIISIGSIDLPAAEGVNVGCVSVKGPADRIAEYPRILQEVIRNCPAASQTAH